MNEATRMADIYANAHVVLSATATEDCQVGFLQKRAEPLVIKYAQHVQKNDGVQEVRARRIESYDCERETQKVDYTLFDRGWGMQERFLACRIIHFLPDEVLFECPAKREYECGAASKEDMIPSHCQGFRIFADLQAAPSMEGLKFGFLWLAILWDYSKMTLTYGSDSLPALSGLAASVEHLKPGKYIAGLWERDIVLQLGWRVDLRSTTRRWHGTKYGDILGPTFSWSSHVRPMDDGACRSPKDICTLVNSRVHLAKHNPYGEVQHASLPERAGSTWRGHGFMAEDHRA